MRHARIGASPTDATGCHRYERAPRRRLGRPGREVVVVVHPLAGRRSDLPGLASHPRHRLARRSGRGLGGVLASPMPVAVGLSRVFASLTPVGEARTGIACERRGLPNNAGYYHGCGLWRSLVARLTGGQEVAGSNPASPTGRKPLNAMGCRWFSGGFQRRCSSVWSGPGPAESAPTPHRGGPQPPHRGPQTGAHSGRESR